ncbi:hypothetical protein GCM10022226_31700 [Sphaerisporangium flaviroseum]|uniref:Uncharacterized protein n=1 Tax=Sphaerisporangium flaviroseum TaxID=509199 RepID=A0ABP7I466_9ACTN
MGWGSMARVIERADQLVLEYVSKVADAAHGVLRTDQRLDFVGRLRARIEEERRGSEDLATVRKVIARFGDPSALLQRELQRLAAVEQEAARRAAGPAPASGATPTRGVSRSSRSSSPTFRGSPSPRGRFGVTSPPARPPQVSDDFGESATEVFPAVVDDSPGDRPSRVVRPPLPRGTAGAPRGASPGRPAPLVARLRQAAMAGANPMATDGRDARTILLNDRREVLAMALLFAAGLLIPFPLPYIAIFPVPVLVWAVAALTVLACEGWVFKDRLTGLASPVAAYVIGGVVLGALRAQEEPGEGLQAFIASFWHVSGLMFMLGAAGGVAWLAYRLFNPPPPPPRRQPLGTVR